MPFPILHLFYISEGKKESRKIKYFSYFYYIFIYLLRPIILRLGERKIPCPRGIRMVIEFNYQALLENTKNNNKSII